MNKITIKENITNICDRLHDASVLNPSISLYDYIKQSRQNALQYLIAKQLNESINKSGAKD